jgi:hypothetical protein
MRDDEEHVGTGRVVGLGAAQSVIHRARAERVSAAYDHEVGVATRPDRLADLGGHQLGRDHVLDPNMMMGALGQQLVLDLDAGEARGLNHIDGPVQMHRVAPAAGAVEDQWETAYGADVEVQPHHFCDREVGLGDALDVAEPAAAEIERGESGGLGELGA